SSNLLPGINPRDPRYFVEVFIERVDLGESEWSHICGKSDGKWQHKRCHIVLRQLVLPLEREDNLETHKERGGDNLGTLLPTRQKRSRSGRLFAIVVCEVTNKYVGVIKRMV